MSELLFAVLGRCGSSSISDWGRSKLDSHSAPRSMLTFIIKLTTMLSDFLFLQCLGFWPEKKSKIMQMSCRYADTRDPDRAESQPFPLTESFESLVTSPNEVFYLRFFYFHHFYPELFSF